MKVIVTPLPAVGNAREFIVEVDVSHLVGRLSIGLYNLVCLQPSSLNAVRSLIIQNAVEVHLRLRRACVNARHDTLHVTEHLLGAKIKSARSSDVVGADHHKYLLGLSANVRLEVVTLLRRIGTRVASVKNGKVVSVRGNEGFCPTMHVGNTVANEDDVVARHGQCLE